MQKPWDEKKGLQMRNGMQASVGGSEMEVGKWGKVIVGETQIMKVFLGHDKEQEFLVQRKVLHK